jgi:threonine dehydratase
VPKSLAPVSLAEIQAAQRRLAGLALRTPVVPCESGNPGGEVFLKLENLQSIGSFKVRPVANAVLAKPAASLAKGLYTLSSGNSALALAWMARRLGVAAAAVVAEGAPEAKLARLRALGARIVQVPFAQWWRSVESCGHAGESGVYVDAVRDPFALAGDATVGIEIIEQLPQLDAIFVSVGGGALACGIACAVRALGLGVPVIACELEGAQPLSAALRAGRVVETRSNPGFVSGVGFHALLSEMWPLCRELLSVSLQVSLAEVAAAIKLLAEQNKVIAEGAGAIPVAAALWGRHPFKRVCAVVSGGNLGNGMLSTILAGGVPP